MSIQIIAAYLLILAASIGGVELFRRWSLKRSLLDVPNERSSHSVPTPRGGGVIIFAVSISALIIFSYGGGRPFAWAYVFGALIIVLISLWDDLRTISPFLRLFFHALAAAAVVWSLGGFEEIYLPLYGNLQLGSAGQVLAFLWIVWLINAYNFMDGIDGIAAVQAVSAGVAWSAAGKILGSEDVFFLGGVLACSSLGFLILNWQPAKIFMGDVGSAFLGYSFAVLPLLAKNGVSDSAREPAMLWFAVIFVWFFVFDTILTFFTRLVRGERVWKPHREHIYQQMVIKGFSHARVATLYGLLSAVLVGVSLYALRASQMMENLILGVILLETLLLVFLWQSVSRKNDRNIKRI